MKLKNFIKKPFVLIIISAVLSALPLTFSCLFALSWFSFVPLFYVLITHSENKLRFAFGRGFLFGFIYHICIYYWFLWFYPLDYAHLTKASSIAVVMLAWFGISAVHGALWCIPTLCCHFVSKVNKNPMLISAVAIIGIIAAEKLTQIGELSFPWARISLGQYRASALIQSVSIFGTDGMDMLILFINALLTLLLIYPFKKRVAAAVAAAVIFFANLGFGLVRLKTEIGGKEITVMTVQGSVEQSDKWSENGIELCYDTYSSLTKENTTDETDLVIWPESAVPKVYKSEKSLKQYKSLSKEIDTPLLVGILLKSDEQSTNNALLVDRDEIKASYTKRQLVPFGEYMPYKDVLSKIFPFLEGLNIIEDDYISGSDTDIIETDIGKIGTVICFESIYTELTRQSVLDGAELMVEVTNDSWLKDSPAMQQHLAHGVFRSIENSRPFIRSANSGISAFIDSRGRIISELGALKQGVITDTVYCSNETTLYTKSGDILFPICLVIVTVWYLLSVIQYFIKKRDTEK